MESDERCGRDGPAREAGEYRLEEIPGGLARVGGPDLPAVELPIFWADVLWAGIEARENP